MEMEKCSHKVKCDFFGCPNMADYTFKTKSFFKSNNLCFCSSCLKEMFETLGKTLIPAPVISPFKNNFKKGGKR